MTDVTRETICTTIRRLDAWMQSMRSADGYTGPISHWWEASLMYCGAMADWRYEGVVEAYLRLYQKGCGTGWLERARAAGDDLIRAQLPDGRFRNSAFQQGPMEGGTPHESAVSIALLQLAKVLREGSDPQWERYFKAAEANIRNYQIGQLWSGRGFLDQPWNQTVVPNKNATLIELLLLYASMTGEDMRPYLEGAHLVIMQGFVSDTDSPRYGGIVHLGTGAHRLTIGIYTARNAAGLVRLFEYDAGLVRRDVLQAIADFLAAQVTADGVRFGYYPDDRPIECPTWISPAGEVLRALLLLQPHVDVLQEAIDQLVRTLIHAQFPGGGIPTAWGLAHKGSVKKRTGTPDFRDVLPVVGWSDKAFRALALYVDAVATPDISPQSAPIDETRVTCLWKGQLCDFIETGTTMQLRVRHKQQIIFHWTKGASYPDVYRL